MKPIHSTISPIFCFAYKLFQIKYRCFGIKISNYNRKIDFFNSFIDGTFNSFQKSTLEKENLNDLFSRLIMIFSLNLIYSHIWYSCLLIVHLPKCSIICSIFFRSRLSPILFDFRRFSDFHRIFPIVRISDFQNSQFFYHVILNKNSFSLKQWINSHCRKNYPNMFFLVKQLNWSVNSAL